MLERLKSKRFYPIVFLTVIVLVSVSLLLFINTFTSIVVENRHRTEIKTILEQIFPGLTDFREKEDLFIVYESENITGYTFLASGNGYSGVIDILVGINTDFTIKGIAILSHSETPGLGSKITEKAFTDQFTGLGLDDMELSRDGGSIDAITGATISSKAVTDAIRRQLGDVIEKIANQ